MGTEVVKLDSENGYDSSVQRAADVLRDGGLVAFPTETVYGLAACVDREVGMERLRSLKARPPDKPFTVHIGSPERVSEFAPDLAGIASRLVRKGWPGPLTLILPADLANAPAAEKLSPQALRALAPEGTIGLRCPRHPVACALLEGVDVPVVASSANRADQPPPHNAEMVFESLKGQVDLIIDAGPTQYAKPSTIVQVSDNSYEVLREGVLDEQMIRRMAALRVLFVCTGNTCRSPMAAALARHMLAERLGCPPAELERSGVVVESAGTFGGGSVTENAVRVMARRGIDISSHRSQFLTTELIQQADYIFALTRGHREAILKMVSSVEQRVALVVNDRDVRDPFGGSENEYEACAKSIEQALEDRMQEVTL